MPLITCPECGHQISTEAEACPQCGHPNRPSTRAPTGPKCYACSATATTRCQSCGALSCAQHLQSIYVRHGDGGAYELRCESCYASAETWKVVGWVVGGVILLVILLIFFASAGHH
ncbi:MAG: zinc ribbon domain-containing protein [Thermoguttaceae bacterium]